MSYDSNQSGATAFHTVAEVSRMLREDIYNQQEFSVIYDALGGTGMVGKGCEIRISVEPVVVNESG